MGELLGRRRRAALRHVCADRPPHPADPRRRDPRARRLRGRRDVCDVPRGAGLRLGREGTPSEVAAAAGAWGGRAGCREQVHDGGKRRLGLAARAACAWWSRPSSGPARTSACASPRALSSSGHWAPLLIAGGGGGGGLTSAGGHGELGEDGAPGGCASGCAGGTAGGAGGSRLSSFTFPAGGGAGFSGDAVSTMSTRGARRCVATAPLPALSPAGPRHGSASRSPGRWTAPRTFPQSFMWLYVFPQSFMWLYVFPQSFTWRYVLTFPACSFLSGGAGSSGWLHWMNAGGFGGGGGGRFAGGGGGGYSGGGAGGLTSGSNPARRRRRRKLRVAGAGASPGGVDRALPRGAGGPPAHPTPQPFAGAARAMRPQMRPQRDPGRTRRHVHAGQVFIQLLPDWRDPRCPTTDRIRLLGLDLDVPHGPRAPAPPAPPRPRRASCRLRVGFVLVLCRVGAGALTGRGATAGAEAAVLGDTPGADGAPGRLCV